ncbi:hypothetical protein [Nocardia carnea]|uniref:hypothetical protein n=1 Tax=Nocardia carnea TaxID=37328 RepID=UPI002456A4FB|nr:hypothetical protein [Nocardia carnea]
MAGAIKKKGLSAPVEAIAKEARKPGSIPSFHGLGRRKVAGESGEAESAEDDPRRPPPDPPRSRAGPPPGPAPSRVRPRQQS